MQNERVVAIKIMCEKNKKYVIWFYKSYKRQNFERNQEEWF